LNGASAGRTLSVSTYLVGEVLGIFGDDAAGELERRGIQRETLDDVQFVAVREVACDAAGRVADRIDDKRIAVPTADRMTAAARGDRGAGVDCYRACPPGIRRASRRLFESTVGDVITSVDVG
jgi:hypothetical protein